MPSVRTPYEAVLHAARDLPKVRTALEAELLGAALLGSVYTVATPPRADAVRDFVGGFLHATARRRTAPARLLRAVFAALAPGADPPPWTAQLGRVRPVDTYAYGDVYGDQTGYLAVFDYEEPTHGGDPHAVVVLVDHNLGVVKDMFVGRPAQPVVATVQQAARLDELSYFTPVDPARLRAETGRHLAATDALATLPGDGGLATDRAVVAARLAVLPEPAGPADDPRPDPAALVAEFLTAPEAAGLPREGPGPVAAEVWHALRLIIAFTAGAPDRDPLRWSPTVAGLFLLDWVHRAAALDDADAATLAAVVEAWTRWAGRRRGLPPAATRELADTLAWMLPEFQQLHRTGQRRSAVNGDGTATGIPRPR